MSKPHQAKANYSKAKVGQSLSIAFMFEDSYYRLMGLKIVDISGCGKPNHEPA